MWFFSRKTRRSALVDSFRRNLTPRLEILEDRCVPANISWDGGGVNFDWNNANNWSTDQLPGPADDVTIDVAGEVTIVHASGTTAINSLLSNESIDLSGG